MKQSSPASYAGFTLSMALTDTLPVILFCVGGALAFRRLQSPLFALGVLLSTAAGAFKAGWKLILALSRRDVTLLPRLFHILMPCGFALMILSIPASFAAWHTLFGSLLAMPSILFAGLGCAGMLLMAVFAAKLDGKNARDNWVEQLTNTTAQALFVIALLLA
jgi:hypothetical protein